MSNKIRLAVAGAGLIGKRHIASIPRAADVALSAVVDPSPEAGKTAAEAGVPWYRSLGELFLDQKPDGVIVATPNRLHVENGLECVRNGCPILVEKPLAAEASEALVLVEAAEKAGIHLLVGHHRRHNPLMQKARAVIDEGELGQLRAAQAICWFYKPDDYFEEAPWRKQRGAGPISVNLVHDIDLIRYLCGDVVGVQAQMRPSLRGYENEDVGTALLTFANGVIGTITVSDMIVSPWSWELTARENPIYPATAESCYLLGGTRGSLELPGLRLWRYEGKRSWWEPISAVSSAPEDFSDPLIRQITHFAEVIRGRESPLVSGREGLKTLEVIEAIYRSAESAQTVSL